MRSALVEKFEEQTEALSTLKVALSSPKYFSNTQVDRTDPLYSQTAVCGHR